MARAWVALVIRNSAGALTLGAALLAAGFGSAEASWLRHDDAPEIFGGGQNPVPNVSDRRGCVRMCDQDTAPCDPPIFKHADGRCTHDY